MRNRAIAILFCFFLGPIGGHKFYLGEIAWGVIYLIFSWTLIPSLAAFVDFFILLLMSDREFDRKFNSQVYGTGTPSLQDSTAALADLKKLYDAGIITAEEYEEKRKKLLRNL